MIRQPEGRGLSALDLGSDDEAHCGQPRPPVSRFAARAARDLSTAVQRISASACLQTSSTSYRHIGRRTCGSTLVWWDGDPARCPFSRAGSACARDHEVPLRELTPRRWRNEVQGVTARLSALRRRWRSAEIRGVVLRPPPAPVGGRPEPRREGEVLGKPIPLLSPLVKRENVCVAGLYIAMVGAGSPPPPAVAGRGEDSALPPRWRRCSAEAWVSWSVCSSAHLVLRPVTSPR